MKNRHGAFTTPRRCNNKISFDSRGEANTYLRMSPKRGGRTLKGNPKPYLCDNCGQWHVGTKPPKRVFDRIAANRGDA